MSSAADRNLLFGILALQMDFVSREQLISAVSIWVLEKPTPLGTILVRQQVLADDRRTLLEALVTEHLKQHGNDPEKSLAAVSSIESVRDQLKQLADPEIEATLVNVSRTRDCTDPLVTVSVGESTSGGLRFRVLRPHAKGGLGEVFVANDEELRREVALKQIQTHHADDPNSRARFLLEAEITGGLEHPGIVPVYGLGTYADGRPFYAMRFIRGDSLKDAIEQFHAANSDKLSPGERTIEFHKLLRRFIDVCNAIEYAHSRGVLHRDLKPGNIMLGKYGETLVVDWGLAKAVGRPESATAGSGEMTLKPTSASGSAPTQMGSAIGTPQYMSPEQAAGRLDQLGPRSDVYSLGTTLYCLLTGQAPLSDRSTGGVGEILRRVQQGEVTPPRQLRSQTSAPSFAIPKPLEAICLKAMALNPADRYSSPRDLADDLEHWLADEPISAERDNLSRRVARWTRRHRALAQSAAAAIALVAAVAIGAVVLINQARQTADDERQIAQRLAEEKARLAEKEARARQQADALAASERQARERADQQTQLALKTLNSVVFDIEYKLDGVAGAGDVRRDLLNTAIEGLRQVARTLDTSTTADHALIASHLELGQTFLDLGGGKGNATDEALGQFQAARELALKLVQTDPKNPKAQRDLSISYSRLGNVNLQLGHVAAARDAYQQALEISQELAQAEPKNAEAQRDLSISHIKLGNVNLELGNVAAARDDYQQALEYRQKLAQADPKNAETQRDLSGSYERLGTVNLKLGNVPAARDAYQQGLEISQKLTQADPMNAEAQRNLSMFFEKLGNVNLILGSVQAARDAYRHELEIGQKLAEADPKNAEAQRDLWVSYNKLGDVNLQLGNAPAARDAYQQGLEISRKLAEADPKNALAKRDLALSYEYLGTVNLQLGNAPAARDAYQQALELRQKLALADPKNAQAQRDLSISCENLGDVSLQLGAVPVARDAYQQAFDIRQKLAQADPKNAQAQRDLSVSYNKLGNVNLQLDNVAAAGDAYQHGLVIFQKLAQADPKNAQAQRDLSVSYNNLGDLNLLRDLSAARNAYRQGLEVRQKLAQADPENARAQCDLAYNFGRLGAVELKAEDYSAAARWLKRGIEILEQLDRDGKIAGQPLYQGWLKDQREQLQAAEAGAAKQKADEKP